MDSAGVEDTTVSWLLFGLGNPGSRYLRTRHNLGWMLIDRMALKLGWTLQAGRADYFFASGSWAGQTLHLIKPTTYMNLSGRAMKQYLAIQRPENARIIVAVDDAVLPLGRLRFRSRGSDGGHNGLASIEAHLGSRDYARLRMGCGPGPEDGDLADFVLEEFADEDRKAVDGMLERAVEAVESWVREGSEPTMGRFNG